MNLKSIVECCDCMKFMEKFPDKFFELAIVDPPYGLKMSNRGNIGSERNGKKSGSKTYRIQRYVPKQWDENAPDDNYFKELLRISTNQIIWGANHFISKIPINSSCWIVWDKDKSGNYADCELAWTSFETAVKMLTWRWNGMLQQDMVNKENRIHPTQKPVALYIWLLQNYAKPGDKILDTHLGSQSSRIAAKKMGFDFWGCEIDQEYFDDGCKRYEKEAAQETLFVPQREKAEQPNLFSEE